MRELISPVLIALPAAILTALFGQPMIALAVYGVYCFAVGLCTKWWVE